MDEDLSDGIFDPGQIPNPVLNSPSSAKQADYLTAMLDQNGQQAVQNGNDTSLDNNAAPKPSPNDISLLARLMYAESAQYPGAYDAIGSTVVNSIGAPGFAPDLKGVIYQPNQFTSVGGGLWTQAGNPATLTGTDLERYAKAYDSASGILNGQTPDLSNGAPFFYSGSVPQGFFENAINVGRLRTTASTDVKNGNFTFLTDQ